jgi:hypothetical protein
MTRQEFNDAITFSWDEIGDLSRLTGKFCVRAVAPSRRRAVVPLVRRFHADDPTIRRPQNVSKTKCGSYSAGTFMATTALNASN